jgi:N-acetylmuramoyl-L-alanine amidase
LRGTAGFIAAILLLAHAPAPRAQGTPPPSPLTLLTREGRRALPTVMLSGQEMIALEDVSSLFGVTVTEDALAGGLTIAYRGRTILASFDQPTVSVDGQIVSLASPVVRAGRRALVPVDFLQRALGRIHDQRIELRRSSRLLIVGNLRVPRVTSRIDAPGPPTRATVEITPASPTGVVSDASRVILRIEADALDISPAFMAGGLIEQIRAGDQPNTLVFVLAPGAGPAKASVTATEAATRVGVEIPAADAPAAPDSPAAAPPTSPSSGVPPLPTQRAAFRTVIIDPGHGGDDAGARTSGGGEEKDLTLDIARRLRGMIEARLGLRVVLTREEDRAVSLDERAAVANNSKGDLFLSIHANTAPSPLMAGAEVLYLSIAGDEQASEAAVEGPALPVLGGATRAIDVVRWDLAQVRHLDSSAALAAILDEELRRRVAMSPRGVQQAPMRVLTAANMPAALIEVAYLTNPGQSTLVARDEFRNSVAQGLFDAVVRYRAVAEEQRR